MKFKQLTVAIFFLLTSAIYAQDTIYFDKYESEIQDIKKAKSYRIFRRDSLDKNLAIATYYFKSGKIKSIANLVDEYSVPANEKKSGLQAFLLDKDGKTKWLNNGKYKDWYENGKLKKDIDFRNGGVNNLLLTYWPNGQVKRRELYDNSWKKLRGECFESDGSPVIFTQYFKSPIFDAIEFSSLQSFVNKNFQYPLALSDTKYAGKMLIYSHVNSNGKISRNIIKRSVQPELDKEVSSFLSKLPECIIPAMCDDEPASFTLISAVIFCKPIYTVDLFVNPTGNDTVFYNKDGFIQETRAGAESIEFLSTSSTNANELLQTTFFGAGKVKTSWTIDKKMSLEKIRKTYGNLNSNSSIPIRTEFMKNRILNGKSMNWYENGQLKNQLNYISNKLEGEQVYYAEDGTVTTRAVFENGKLISGNMPVEKDITDVEIMPQFPGGESELLQYINKNIRYPISAQQRKVTGKVVVRFVIETDGSVDRIEVLRSVDSDLDNEAIRVIQSMPNWTPGMIGSKTVPVWYTLPFTFKLNGGSNFDNPSSIQNNDLLIRNNDLNRTFPTRRF